MCNYTNRLVTNNSAQLDRNLPVILLTILYVCSKRAKKKNRETREQLKSCETSDVPYTCRYTSGYSIPNSGAAFGRGKRNLSKSNLYAKSQSISFRANMAINRENIFVYFLDSYILLISAAHTKTPQPITMYKYYINTSAGWKCQCLQ